MSETRKALSSKYDLATRVEVEALRDEMTAALVEMRRTFAKVTDDLMTRHVSEAATTTAALESMHRYVRTVDEHVDAVFMRVAVRVADLEDRTLSARWQRFTRWFTRPIW